MDNESAEFKAPYLSFQTFWNFLADLSSKPLPPKLDRSIMANKSGTDQNNLMSALQAFELVGADGVIRPEMQVFAEADVDQRKQILAALLRRFYAAPLQVSEANGTPDALSAAFRDALELTSSDTRRKAITFFLHAAREADIELSPHFPKTRAGSGNPSAPKKRSSSSRKRSPQTPSDPPPAGDSTPQVAGRSSTVLLRSGGTVTLTYDIDLFEVDDEDQQFVLELVNKLRRYDSGSAAPTTEAGAS